MLINNLSSIITIIVAIISVILNAFNILPSSAMQSIIISLLALLSIDQLFDTKKRLEKLNNSVHKLSDLIGCANIKRFDTVDEALLYIVQKTKSAKVSIDQASIDKQRARKTTSRIKYEKAREDVISTDRIKYRYIGIADINRRFSAVRKIMEKKQLHNFYTAFLIKSIDDVPLMSFTIFDKEEVIIRVPYDLGEESEYMAIHSKEIANLFLGYFKKMWDKCQKVMEVEELDNILNEIKQRNIT
jgi:hypothetical protein